MSKITHEQARQHLENKIKDGNILTVLEYIKQQEKQEKLLELYRKLSVIRNDLLSYCEVVDDDYDDFEYIEIDLEKQIKELEK